MKILALGASTSSKSINRKLANYAARQVGGAEVTDLDLRGYQLPIFSVDDEEQNGTPADAQAFLDAIRAHDGIVISMAEHNGSYAAAFKNLFDWTSRIEQKLWSDKPMLLLASSPGARGGTSVLAAAEATFPHLAAKLVATFSLPSFYDNFSDEEGIAEPGLRQAFLGAVAAFEQSLQ